MKPIAIPTMPTSVFCDIRDSLGVPLTGYVRITLDYYVAGDSAKFLSVPAKAPLVNGQVTLSLEPSEVARVTYLFEVVQTQVVVTVVEGVSTSTTIETLVDSFRAKIPASASPLNLKDLVETGITHEALDGSLAAISRRLYLEDNFWDKLRLTLFNPRGTWSPIAFYKRGDVVLYDGGSYLYTFNLITQGVLPTLATHWISVALRGQTGAGTTGNDQAYGVAWDSATDAPSRNAVYDIVQTLATSSQLNGLLVNSSLTSPTLASAIPALNDTSSKIPSTDWVQQLVNTIRVKLTPVGMMGTFLATSAPTGWLICDGRTVSRTTYAELFALISTAFNTGGEAGTDYRLPDLRGRAIVGMDNISALRGSANTIVGTWADSLGGKSGFETHQLTIAEMPSHTHGINMGTATTTYAPAAGSGIGATSGSSESVTAGGGGAHNNMQPSIALVPMVFAGV